MHHRGQLEKLVPLVREATLDPLAHPVSRVFQVLLEKRARRYVSSILW